MVQVPASVTNQTHKILNYSPLMLYRRRFQLIMKAPVSFELGKGKAGLSVGLVLAVRPASREKKRNILCDKSRWFIRWGMLNRIITPLATLLLLLCGRGRLSGHIITVTRLLRWIFKYEGQLYQRMERIAKKPVDWHHASNIYLQSVCICGSLNKS